MKAKQLFSICAVLSPIVIASTFSVQALSATTTPYVAHEVDHQATKDFNQAETEKMKSQVSNDKLREMAQSQLSAQMQEVKKEVETIEVPALTAPVFQEKTAASRAIADLNQPVPENKQERGIANTDADKSDAEKKAKPEENPEDSNKTAKKQQPSVIVGKATRPKLKFNEKETPVDNKENKKPAKVQAALVSPEKTTAPKESMEEKLKKDQDAITQQKNKGEFQKVAQLQNIDANEVSDSEKDQTPKESMEDKLKKDQDRISLKLNQAEFEQIAQLQTEDEDETSQTENIDLDALLEKSNDVIAQIDAALGVEPEDDEFKEIDFGKLFEMSDDVIIQYEGISLKDKTEEVQEKEEDVKEKVAELKDKQEKSEVAEAKEEEKAEDKKEEDVNDKIAELEKELEQLQAKDKKRDAYVGKLEKAYCSTPTNLNGFMKMQMMQMAQTSQLIQLLTTQMAKSSNMQMNYGMDSKYAQGYFQARQDFGLGQQRGAGQDQYRPTSMPSTTNNYYINKQDPFSNYGADPRLTTNSELPRFGFDFTQTLPNQDRFSQMNGQNSNVQRNLSAVSNMQNTQNVDWLNADLNNVLFNNNQQQQQPRNLQYNSRF